MCLCRLLSSSAGAQMANTTFVDFQGNAAQALAFSASRTVPYTQPSLPCQASQMTGTQLMGVNTLKPFTTGPGVVLDLDGTLTGMQAGATPAPAFRAASQGSLQAGHDFDLYTAPQQLFVHDNLAACVSRRACLQFTAGAANALTLRA